MHENQKYYDNDGQYDDLGFTVINANSDTEPPKLISIKTNHQGETLSSGDELEIIAEVQDESELGFCHIVFKNKSTNLNKSILLNKEEDGKLHGRLTINNDITSGVYKASYIGLCDVHENQKYYDNDGQYDDLNFTVVEDEELKNIKSIDHAYVVSSSTANKTYDGDVYIAPNCNVTLSNVTVKGTIYVLGALQANSINAKGIVGTSLSFGGWAYGNGSISVSGSNSYESLKMTSYPVEDIPFKLTTEELKSVNGKISYSGAVVDIADMYVNDRKVNVIDGKFHVKNQDIGDADQLTFKWVTVFGNTITKQFKVKKVVTDTTGKENNLPELNVMDQNVCVESDLSFLKQGISAKDDEDGDLTNKIQIDSHALDISRVGTYPVDYAVEDSQNGKTKKTIYIHVNEHQWNSPTVIKKSTCTQDGLQETTCSVCGKKETKVIPALGHNYGDWKPLNDKQHQRVCENDSSHVEKADHHFDEGKITTEPTYTKEGVKTYTCKDCGYTKTEKVAIIPHTHNYKDEVTKQPTCIEQGTKTYTCSICGDSYTKDIPALGHNYGDWKPLNDKQHQRVCKNDSSHVEKEDHHFDEGKITTEPTYTKEGVKTYTCKDCGYIKTEKVAIIPHTHNYKEGITKQPTCTEQGIKTYTCSICGDSYTKDIPALGHNYGEWKSLNDQQHQRVCKNDSSHVEKADHHFDEGKITIEPTYTKEGIKTYTCKDCGYTKTEKVAIKPHNHNYKEEVTKQPTCTEQGTKTYTCSICGDSYTKDIPALGHNYGEWTKADDKKHQRVCKNDSTHVEKEDHKWDQGKVTKAATTDTEGVKTYTCTVCHATKEEKIAKLPAVKKNEPKTQATNTSAVSEKKEAAAQTKENTAKQPQPMTKNQDAKLATKASPKVQFSTTQVIDRKVTTLKGDRDISGSQFGLLQAKANKVTKSSIKVQWKKIKGAKGYIIYGNKCGKKYQKLTSVKGLFWTQRKLKKGTYYKYMVVAYNGKGKAIAYSKTIHVTTLGGKKVNPTNVKLKSPKKLTLKVKKKAQIKASYVLAKKAKMSNHRGLAYESSNTKVASVSKKGQITAKKKGVCTIYVYGQNGSMNKVQVKVQ